MLFNVVLGLRKLDPLVDSVLDPVTDKYMIASHQAVLDALFGRGDATLPDASKERLLEESAWFRVEIASQRGVCIDRYHVGPSFQVPLWDTEHFAATRDHERAHPNRNVPAVLLRRILRTEIAKEETPRVLSSFEEICRRQEFHRASDAHYDHHWPPRPDNLSMDVFWHVTDLHYVLAPFTETAAFLFPLLDDEAAVLLAVQTLRAVLGRSEYVFEQYRIPPPSEECLGFLQRMAEDPSGRSWYPALAAHYQFYTTLLWRITKAHRLQAALKHMMDFASRSVLDTEYCADQLQLIEYRVQLFVDTHISIYAYAFGDGGCWTDCEWMLGPDTRDEHADADVTSYSPITRFYPHCRNVLVCESEFPDASSVIELGNLRYDVNLKPQYPTQRQAFIHLFACKVLSQRCLKRNFKKILLRYIEGCKTNPARPDFLGYPSIKEYVALLMRCSLLGNWKACEVRANFSKRIEIEYAFLPVSVAPEPGADADVPRIHPTRAQFHGSWNQKDSLNRWITQREDLVFYIFKEAHVHLFEKRASLDIVMSRNQRWGRYKNVVRACMDRVRYIYNNDGGVSTPDSALMDWLEPLCANPQRVERQRAVLVQMERAVKHYHKMSKLCFIKLRKGPFQRVLLKHMNTALSRIREGRLSQQVLLAQRSKDMSFFHISAKEEGDDEDEEEDDGLDGERRAQTGSSGSHGDNDIDRYIEADNEDEAVHFGSGDDDEDDEDELLRQERNLVAPAKFIRDLAVQIPDIDIDLMDMVARDVMRRQQSRWRVELHWLVELFGVDLENVRALQRIYSAYETYDTPDHPIIQRVAQIYVASPRDFNVIRLYLGMLLWHSDQLFMPLAKDMRWRQILALRKRWDVPTHQDVVQDLGWGFFNPGNRRWYTTEAVRKPVKTDPDADHKRMARDRGLTTQDDEEVRIEGVAAILEKQQRDAEEACSMNMNRVTYDHRDGMLYAKTRSEPSLRYLQNRENNGDQMMLNAEEELIAIAEAHKRTANPNDPNLNLNGHDDGNDNEGDDVEDNEDDIFMNLGPRFGGSIVTSDYNVLYTTEDFTIYVSNDEESRQLGALSETARKRYREEAGYPYLHDSRCSDPLVAMDLVGVVKYLNDKPYTLCALCGCITPFHSASIETFGPYCGSHDLEAHFKRNRHFLSRAEVVPLPSKRFQEAARAAETFGEDISESAQVAPNGTYEDEIRCIFCRTFTCLSSPSTIHKRFNFIMTDPVTRQVKRETHHVCKIDYKYARRRLDPAMVVEDRPSNFKIRGPSTDVPFEFVHASVASRRLKYNHGRRSRRSFKPGW